MEAGSWQIGPRSGGKILDLAFNIYFGNIVRLMAAASVVIVPLTVLTIILNVVAFAEPGQFDQIGLVDIGNTTRQVDLNLYNTLQIVIAVVTILSYLLVIGVTYTSANAAYLGQQVDVSESIRPAFRKLHSLLWVSILTIVFTALGLIALFVGAIVVAVMLAVAIPVLMVEDIRGFKACRRSWDLIRKNGWRTFGVLFVAGIFTGLITVIASLIAEGANGLAEDQINLWIVVTQLLGGIAYLFAAPFSAVVTVVIYYDVRIRKEGFDIERLAGGIGEGEGAVPPAALGSTGYAPGTEPTPGAPTPPPPPPGTLPPPPPPEPPPAGYGGPDT
jgi:hypothetical protein